MVRKSNMPRSRTRPGVCLPFETWPEADRRAWKEAVQEPDPFGPASVASRWSERSRIKTGKGYSRWLGWCSERGLDLQQSPADRVTRDTVRAYIDDLRLRNADLTVLCRVQELHDALRALAPRDDWSWLRQVQNHLRARARPARDKRASLQPAGELVQLGAALMRTAEMAIDKPLLGRAVLYRDGLIIMFLAYRPLRLSNVGMMRHGHHLFRHSRGYRLSFAAGETKARLPFDAAVPDHLTAAFDRYFQHYRPILLTCGDRRTAAPTDAVWIAETGTAMNPLSIPNRIKKHTRAAFGRHLWTHLFRDCAGTTIAIEDPKHARIISAVLGHNSITTSEKHYNQATSLDASRRYQEIIAELVNEIDNQLEDEQVYGSRNESGGLCEIQFVSPAACFH